MSRRPICFFCSFCENRKNLLINVFICVSRNHAQVIPILLQNTCFNDGDVNLVQFLQEIASEQQFEVTYVDIEEKSISGKFKL